MKRDGERGRERDGISVHTSNLTGDNWVLSTPNNNCNSSSSWACHVQPHTIL